MFYVNICTDNNGFSNQGCRIWNHKILSLCYFSKFKESCLTYSNLKSKFHSNGNQIMVSTYFNKHINYFLAFSLIFQTLKVNNGKLKLLFLIKMEILSIKCVCDYYASLKTVWPNSLYRPYILPLFYNISYIIIHLKLVRFLIF